MSVIIYSKFCLLFLVEEVLLTFYVMQEKLLKLYGVTNSQTQLRDFTSL